MTDTIRKFSAKKITLSYEKLTLIDTNTDQGKKIKN